MAALAAAESLKSGSPRFNDLAAELALGQARENFIIAITEHVPGVTNTWADALSRLDQPDSGATVPQALCALTRTRVPAPLWRAEPDRQF